MLTTAACAAHATPVTAATPAVAESAIGNAAVQWIAVSPAYPRTGTVVATAVAISGCSKDCAQLWLSHDGGGSWHRAAAQGWDGMRPQIVIEGHDHEIMLVRGSSSLLRSDDDGATWRGIGPSGEPTVDVAQNGTDVGVVVAGARDYRLAGTAMSALDGSRGAMVDQGFMLSPAYPSGGSFAPALLTGLDPHSGQPEVAQCDSHLACTSVFRLPHTAPAGPPVLLPSAKYVDDGVVYAQTEEGVDKSTDGGATFVPAPIGLSGATATATPMLALSPGYSDGGSIRSAEVAVIQLFGHGAAMHTSGGIYRTTDAGRSWQPLAVSGPFARGAGAVAFTPDGRTLAGYVNDGGRAGLLCSTDGESWHALCPPSRTTGLAPPRADAACPQAPCGISAPPVASVAPAGRPTPMTGLQRSAPATAGRAIRAAADGVGVGATLGATALLGCVGLLVAALLHIRRRL